MVVPLPVLVCILMKGSLGYVLPAVVYLHLVHVTHHMIVFALGRTHCFGLVYLIFNMIYYLTYHVIYLSCNMSR